MSRAGFFIKRIMLAVALLLALWLPLLAYGKYVAQTTRKDLPATTCRRGFDTERLAQYHGTNALKITCDRVYIWRDGEWLSVMVSDQG